PRPRVFRYPARRALVNRMGFNNPGAVEVARRMEKLRASGRWPRIPIGFNIGKSRAASLAEAPADYLASFRALAPFADYMVVNVSSPNTPGLRDLQEAPRLREILKGLRAAGPRMPLLVKIAPDLSDSAAIEIAELAAEIGLAGIIATNTTLDHSALAGCQDQEGGLSGAPLESRSTELAGLLARHSPLPIVASGGVMDAASASAKWKAGAQLAQIYTGFVYRGPALIREILRSAPAP
ncbi:MAG: quinone-dependent dihydroorotate dehydrogenase, partial [Terrimicrobiaceae bacterium]|nr:quinone-dependent dihydroorotate dehydrogenase [Terrimicrobiaceae bacterium]